MKKGYKKFTVPYEGTYFDGGKIFGRRVVFAESEEMAKKKVQDVFDCRDDEPITYAGKPTKWVPGETTESEIYPYWQ